MSISRIDHMGEVWPDVFPGAETADYGQFTLSPEGPVEVRSFQSFTLVYTVGEYGLDDTGAIKLVQRWTADNGVVQCHDPAAPNYVTATASNGVSLELHIEPYPHQRPWYNGLRITVVRGYMEPGDTITIVLGDRSCGSPGYRLQTFSESCLEFLVLVDACATGVFLPLPSRGVEVVPAAVDRWALAAPTLRRPGELFAIGIRPEDHWGNATGFHPTRLRLRASGPIDGLPAEVDFPVGQRALRIEGLSIAAEGVTRVELLSADGTCLARSNPILVRPGAKAAWWGDLHGQSGETVGINTIRDYFRFARDIAFLDVTSHQANDFQITKGFWAEINAVSAEFDAPGRFTAFPGYEWSGNTPLGGDHNVFFRHEGEQIHRSSHSLLRDRSDLSTDAHTVRDLFAALHGRDCVLYAHVGGRPADISRGEDARLRTAVEVHSDWGTFEWILTDAFRLGYRVGVVCNSDVHKGAPGAAYPGASEFGAASGLTCFLADELSRDGILASMRRRHHFGTTGCRAHVDVQVHLGPEGLVHPEDPRWSDRPGEAAEIAVMGDIARSPDRALCVDVAVHSDAPVLRIDVMCRDRLVETVRPYAAADLGRRVRVVWEGAEYRGRGRQTRWQGSLRTSKARIERIGAINSWNLERATRHHDHGTVDFDTVTTGNFGGVDLWLDDARAGSLIIDTGLVKADLPLAEIGIEERVLAAGGLERCLRVSRLPETLEVCEMHCSVTVPVADDGRDSPIWVRITTEDGHRIWTSPVYIVPG
ncbi:MAG: DUF3604 domain-containing protein [Rhizobiales bacterium]|nr:DUF3604 domain-containing protein [Hyphomicrobiales bacterium]